MDSINKTNILQINVKAIISATNIPYAEGMIDILEQKGIMAFHDFVSNGGAVLVESMMFNAWNVDQLYEHLKTRITNKTIEILNGAHENHTSTYEFAKSEAVKELNKQIIKRKRKIERLNKKF